MKIRTFLIASATTLMCAVLAAQGDNTQTYQRQKQASLMWTGPSDNDGSAAGTLQFRPLLESMPTETKVPLVTIVADTSLNRAIGNLAAKAGLGYVPSPHIGEKVTDTTSIPEGPIIEMINTLLSPYGYRALVRAQTVEVFGKNIDQHFSRDVLYYKFQNLEFLQLLASPRADMSTGFQNAGSNTATNTSSNTGRSGGSSGEHSNVLPSMDLSGKDTNEFFSKLKRTILSDAGEVQYDPKSRTVIARDLPPYLEMLRQYLRSIDQPAKMIVTHLQVYSVSFNPERNQGIDYGAILDGFRVTVKERGMDDDTVTGAATSALSGVINFPGFNSPGRNGLSLSIPELTTSLNLIRKFADVDLMQEEFINSQDGMPAHTFFGEQLTIVIPGTPATGAGTSSAPLTMTPEIGDMVTMVAQAGRNDLISLAFNLTSSKQNGSTTYGGTAYPQFAKRAGQQYLQIPSGKTVLLSGYFIDQQNVTKTSLPILGDIPVLGSRLFGNTKTSRSRQKILFLLTPRVISSMDVAQIDSITSEMRERAKVDRSKANDYVWPEIGMRDSPSGLLDSKKKQPAKPVKQPAQAYAPLQGQLAEPIRIPEDQQGVVLNPRTQGSVNQTSLLGP